MRPAERESSTVESLRERAEAWRQSVEKAGLGPVSTDSGIALEPLYTPEHRNEHAYLERLGFPGQWPFTRGVYPTMYRGRLWTIRQYAGLGTPQETNARFKYLLERGQTGLSVAFDLPTQLGLDSTDPSAEAEVGRVGVAVDTVDDLIAIFDDIPLDQVSVHFTINATAPIILAMYLVAAEERGIDWHTLRGTLQNDIIKEFLARNAYIFPPRPSMRLVGDVITFCAREVPKFNAISISGYHAREAGCTAVEEIGFALLAGKEYVHHVLSRGLDVDEFAPQLSFHFSSQRDFFEEICKVRAARRLWARIARDELGARREDSMRMRFFCGGSGASLSSREPLNNVVRGTLQCLAGVLGGAQACHVPSYDEAYRTPSQEAALLSVRTQQIIAYESGVARVIDPLGGSYFVEWLTDTLEGEVQRLMERMEQRGGLLAAIERGEAQEMIRASAYELYRREEEGERLVVGENAFVVGEDAFGEADGYVRCVDLEEDWDPHVREWQRSRLAAVLSQRHEGAVRQQLRHLQRRAEAGENVLPAIIECVRARATLGEITKALVAVFGRFTESTRG